MKTSTLGQLLNDEQVEAVRNILNTNRDCRQRVKKLKEYFRTIELELLAKDILPDYLAYAVEANYQFTLEQIAANN